MNRSIFLGLVLVGGLFGAWLFLLPSHSGKDHAASHGATTVNLVKLPSSSGGVSVGLTKLPRK